MKKLLSVFKIVSLILTASLLLSSVAVMTFGANGQYEGFVYAENENGTITITDYTGDAVHVEIPSEINGKKVTEIGNEAFMECLTMETVNIPASIKKIGERAFNWCENLKEVVVPKSVKSLGREVFADCSRLETAVILGGVKEIPPQAFITCGKLKTVAFGTGVEVIGTSAFWCCTSLETIIFSNTVKVINDQAFYWCSSLNEIFLPIDLEYIGQWAFEDCTLEAIYYPGTEEQLQKVAAHENNKDVFETPIYLYDTFLDVPWDSWFAPAVAFVNQTGLMVGTSAKSFEPDSGMSRAMLVTVLWRLEGSPAPAGSTPFTDLKQAWYKDAVAWAYENDIVKGISDTRFSPNGAITREQIATILYRYSNFKGIETTEMADISAYPDAGKVQSYAADAMSWANAAGLITGSPVNKVPHLLPRDSATRAQVATILMRYCEKYLAEAE